MNEIWQTIPGFNDWYQASNLGRIRSVDREIPCKQWNRNSKGFFLLKGRILQPTINSTGYRIYNISLKANTPKSYRNNRMVCAAFHPNPENLKYVNHKDGDKLNDNKDNLEWTTSSDNQKHAYRLGLRKRTFIIPKVICPQCGIQISSNKINIHIKLRHS